MNQTELKKLLNKKAGHNKYGNHKVHCLSKHLHDSKLEANYCNRLLAMKQKKEIFDYRTQISFEMVVAEQHICSHIVDFLIYLKPESMLADIAQVIFQCSAGLIEVHDTKGVKTDVFIIKHKLFKALYPHIEYKIITAH